MFVGNIKPSLSRFGARSRLLMLLLLTGGLLIADSLVMVEDRQQERIDQTKAELQLAAVRAADRQYEVVSAARQLLAVVTTIAPDVDVCSKDFLNINDAGGKWLRRISLIAPDGEILCSTGGFYGRFNISDQVHFQQAIAKRGFALGNYLISVLSDDPVLIAAAPRLANNGTVLSVITAVIDLAYLNEIAGASGLGADTQIMLIDANGTIAVASDNARDRIGQNVNSRAYLRALDRDPGSVVDVEDEDGERRFYASAPLPDTGARIVIGAPQHDIVTEYRRAAFLEIGFKTLLVIALLAFFWVAAHSLILSPIRQLTRAAKDFKRGDREARVNPDLMTREFADLAETLNRLVEQVARKEAIIVERSLTLERANARLETLATQDELTGLANRRALVGRLAELFLNGAETASYALLVIDLDKFKPVNDVFGHAAGDLILRETAQRLRDLCGHEDLAARLGGDEFALLISLSKTRKTDAQRIARQVVRALSADFATAHGIVRIGGTVGVAIAGHDGTDPDDLLRAADVAMYRAKQARSGYCFFARKMQEELEERVAMEKRLREAVPRGEIVPFYQPIVDLSDGRIVGVEMLARWIHPDLGVVTPDRFIPIVAEIGLADAMTRQLVARACEDARDWPAHVSLALNLSPTQLGDPSLPTQLAAVVESRGLALSRLEIEVTEDALARDFSKARDALAQFRRVGMCVALDDFGTGYSSLQHLHELKFDRLKIDRAFIRELRFNDDVKKLVSTILSLARNMHLTVVAEGIEAPEEAAALAAMGCGFGQGYLFGRPMPASEIAKRLAAPDTERSLRA